MTPLDPKECIPEVYWARILRRQERLAVLVLQEHQRARSLPPREQRERIPCIAPQIVCALEVDRWQEQQQLPPREAIRVMPPSVVGRQGLRERCFQNVYQARLVGCAAPTQGSRRVAAGEG